jgi:hypothetical protein
MPQTGLALASGSIIGGWGGEQLGIEGSGVSIPGAGHD